MIPNTTSLNASEIATAAASNSNQFNYQNLAVIFAAITVAITLVAIVYKYGQHVGEMKGIKEVIDAKLESIDQKYNTTEKLQKLELNVNDKAGKDYVDKSLSDAKISIMELTVSTKGMRTDIAIIKNDINQLETLQQLILKNRIDTANKEKTVVYDYEDFPGHA